MITGMRPEPDDRPRLLWSAPGSLFIDRVTAAWEQRGRLADLARVSGPWAVVLWDPATSTHLAVTDPIGVQPLYWARTATGSVAVSSLLHALADRPDVDDRVGAEGLIRTGGRIHVPEDQHPTSLQDIWRLSFGRALRVSSRGTTVEQYWDPRDIAGPDESLSLDDCAQMLRERIDNAIRRLLPADGQGVGGHVSSGIDCSTMTARANQILAESGGGVVAGYSWSPDESVLPRLGIDERDLLDDVTRREGFPIRRIPYDETGDWFEQTDPLRYPGETLGIERWSLAQARADGVTTMLSGWGGDELSSFNGRHVYEALVRRGKLLALWHETGSRATVYSTSGPVTLRGRASVFKSAVGAGALHALPQRLRRGAREEDQRRQDVIERLSAVSPAAAAAYERSLRTSVTLTKDHHDYQLALFSQAHIQARTSAWFQAGELMGVRYRYPLLDLDVVEAAFRMPWWAFRSRGWNRIAYRKAVSAWIPDSVAWNILKNEPAVFTWRQQNGSASALPPRSTRESETYERLLALGESTRPPRPDREYRGAAMLIRPEAAPV